MCGKKVYIFLYIINLALTDAEDITSGPLNRESTNHMEGVRWFVTF